MGNAAHNFDRLSVSERIQLVEDLWDSIAVSTSRIPLSEAEIAELDRRLAELDRNPDAVVPWEEVRARIEEQLRLCT